jgi:DNA-binding transcriptional regulator YhcF (GntR family)
MYLKNGVTGRLETYLLENPDEELSFRDMQTKFNCSIAAISRAVCMLREEGILEDKPRVVRLTKEFR